MQITEDARDGLRREYTVVVPQADVESRLLARLSQVSNTARVPGFRPGKIPVAVARQRWAGELHPEIVGDVVRDVISRVIDEQELDPAATPEIELVRTGRDDDLECRVVIDVLPEIPPIDFAAITLEKHVTEVGEDEIEETLATLARHKATYTAVPGRAAADGDRVSIDSVDTTGEDREPQPHTITLGDDGEVHPEITRQLLGATAGETRRCEIAAADGDTHVLEIAVREVAVPELPDIDDALAESFGCENLAELRRRVREERQRAYGETGYRLLKRALLDELAGIAEFELPQSLLDHEFEPMWARVARARERGELDDDDMGKPEEELRRTYLDIARRRVALGLIMSHTAKTAGIRVDDAELERQERKFPGESAERLRAALHSSMLEDKIAAYILEKVNTTERRIAPDEMRELAGARLPS